MQLKNILLLSSLFLLQVSVQVDLSEAEEFEEVASISLKKMEFGSTGQTYVALKCNPEGALALGKFANILKFRVKEVRTRF